MRRELDHLGIGFIWISEKYDGRLDTQWKIGYFEVGLGARPLSPMRRVKVLVNICSSAQKKLIESFYFNGAVQKSVDIGQLYRLSTVQYLLSTAYVYGL